MKVENKYINKFPVLLAMAFMVIAASCVKETDEGEPEPLPPVEIGMVRLDLYTTSGEYTDPATRVVADENFISTTPMVLVFRGDDQQATFVSATRAQYSGGKSTVVLAESTEPSVLIIIANSPDDKFFNGSNEVEFSSANINSALAGKTLGQSEDILKTIRLGGTLQSTLPFSTATSPLPMSAGLYLQKINSSTTIGVSGSELMLTRSLAKATVSVGSDLSGIFTLQSVGLVNAPRNGSLYRAGTNLPENTGNLTHYLKSQAGDGVGGMADAVSNTTVGSPIYIYEIAAGQGTALILKGRINNQTRYYRMDFFHEGKYLDIVRNKHYKFNITEVGVGHTTMESAISSPTSDITFTITVADSYSYDVVSNNDFYIGVSNSAVVLYSAATSITTAFRVTTNATASTGFNTGKITYVGVSSTTTAISLASNASSPVTTTVNLTMPAHVTEGTATIQIGSLKKTIHVTRPGMMGYQGRIKLPHEDYVSCEFASRGTGNWLYMSSDGTTRQSSGFVLGAPGELYLLADENRTNSARSGGDIYVVRGNAQGRTRILVSQDYYR